MSCLPWSRTQGLDRHALAGLDLARIDVLEIPDEFAFMDADLQEMLRLMLDPEIDL